MDKFEASRRRRELRQRAVDFLGGKCEICGYTGTPVAFDFHHLDYREKDFNLSAKMTSWKAIEAELKKCVLLCARCHREVHDGYHPHYIVKDHEVGGWDEDDLAEWQPVDSLEPLSTNSDV